MKTKSILSFISSAVFLTSAMPAVGSAAECLPDGNDGKIRLERQVQVDFAVLGFSEKNGEMTITDCYDYADTETFPATGNYIAVCIFDRELTIPSHINGKPVTAVNSLSGNKKISKLIIPESVADIPVTAYSGCTLTVEKTDKECRLGTVGYLLRC